MRITIDIPDTTPGAPPVEIRTSGWEPATQTGSGEVTAGGLPRIQEFDGGADQGTPTLGAAAMRPTSSEEASAARNGGEAPDLGETTTGRPIPVQIEASVGPNGRTPAG
jgi:hypothetical protein